MCSQIFSMLSSIFSAEEASLLNKYFSSLTGNAISSITASRASIGMGISPEYAMKLLSLCYKADILSIDYAIRCPECNTIIKRYPANDGMPNGVLYCYACQNDIDVSPESIEIIYKLEMTDFFPNGQQDHKSPVNTVAPSDSLKNFIDQGGDYNKLFFNPKSEEFETWKVMYTNIFTRQKTSKATGDTLEGLVQSLFSSIHCVRACSIKTETNQIDCYTRNGFASALPFLGNHIVIECKNENKTPGNTYLLKIGGIISGINGRNGNHVSLGIIVSKKKPAKTVSTLAYTRYITDGVSIISIHNEELYVIIYGKQNLLELIERKVNEMKLRATTDLKVVGLYD